jgi:hypothetical protein
MNSRRMGAAFCRTIVLPSWLVASWLAHGPATLEKAEAPIVEHPAVVDHPAPPAVDQPVVADHPAPPTVEQPAVADQPAPPAVDQPAVADRPAPPAIDQPVVADQPPPPAVEQSAVADHPAPPAVARPEPQQPVAVADNSANSQVDGTITTGSEPAADAVTTNSEKTAATVEAALTDPAQVLPPEPAPSQAQTAIAPVSRSRDAKPLDSVEILDECWVVDACIDRYLWALYQRAPKEDTISVSEQRQVTVKRKGKMVTVTRTISKPVDEDFSWKDPKAAARMGMSMTDYVIGGVTPNFKLKLFHLLYAAEQAGLSPGITSAFRDDYRQSIASGLAAASNRSYHGGSLHGGYGHGLAADVVSIAGATRDDRWASSEKLWKWIDAHTEFGIGRPYLGRDPAHLAPIDGKEYVDHRGGGAHVARAESKKRVRTSHAATKHPKTAKSSKVRTT